MPTARHYDYVPTATVSNRGRRVGRPPVPDSQKLLNEVRIGMTDAEAAAFERWMKKQSIPYDRAAAKKIMLDRLKADGFLKD
jgi:hypothetical protein